jgi:hypothetical protein
MFVRVPVETSQAVLGSVAMSAPYVASRYPTSVTAGSIGCGSSVTPSRPDSPDCVSQLLGALKSSRTMYISGVDCIAYNWLRSP